jgi:hypothetical protein
MTKEKTPTKTPTKRKSEYLKEIKDLEDSRPINMTIGELKECFPNQKGNQWERNFTLEFCKKLVK